MQSNYAFRVYNSLFKGYNNLGAHDWVFIVAEGHVTVRVNEGCTFEAFTGAVDATGKKMFVNDIICDEPADAELFPYCTKYRIIFDEASQRFRYEVITTQHRHIVDLMNPSAFYVVANYNFIGQDNKKDATL